MFDVLAFYAESHWISEKTVLREWGHSLARSKQHADLFIAHRAKLVHANSWPHYQALARKALEQKRDQLPLTTK